MPYDGGSTVTSYVLLLKTASGTWEEELTYCNARADFQVISNMLCSVPMSVLQAEPYLLQ